MRSEAKDRSGPPTPGEVFAGRYVVEERIGRGGGGAVYRVYDRALGEHVALKLLSSASDDARAAERFRSEVRLARRITHINVARTFDFGACAGQQYLTMELLSGPTLRRLIDREKSLPPDRAAEIGRQICEGLSAAHGSGIVHRDLKPQNVVLEPSGRVVILDFGIASAVGAAGELSEIVGTPAYMAPETLSSSKPGPATDLFSLGLILHEMLSGKLPSWNGSERDPIARLGGVSPMLALHGQPKPLSELVARLLDPEPSRRPESAAAVARELAELQDLTELVDSVVAADTVRFAPLPESGRMLLVLPFSERGSDSGIGADLAYELTDALARTRGLKVLASRAGGPRAEADPVEAGREQGAALVVNGWVQRRADTLRTTAHLIEVESGVQVWTEQFDGRLEDVIIVVERTAQKIAEALRLELTFRHSRGSAPAQAVQLYFDARRQHRRLAAEATETLSRAMQLAPDFQPAIALRALILVRRIFSYAPEERAVASRAVEDALELAPELPETQLAAAIVASLDADYPTAARLLRNAVTIAPTFADAQEYLGQLQLEAGRTAEGVERLELALALDPVSPLGASALLRHYIFTGSPKEHAAREELLRRTGGAGTSFVFVSVREAMWQRDPVKACALRGMLPTAGRTGDRLLRACFTILGGEAEPAARAEVEDLLRQSTVPRFTALIHQVVAEAWAAKGQFDYAAHHVVCAAGSALADTEWLDHCPCFEPIRRRPEVVEATRQVRERASAIWAA